MADETTLLEKEPETAAEEKSTPVSGTAMVKNPFDESTWTETPGEQKTEEKPPVTTTTAASEEEDEIFDENDYIEKNFGWKSPEEVKAAKARLEELEKLPKPTEGFKFKNEVSEKIANAINEGNEEELFTYFKSKREIERAEKMDAAKPEDAEQILKVAMAQKYKDLTPDEIDYKFNKLYPVPPKPKQGEDQLPEEYEMEVRDWERQVAILKKEIVIDAKLAKPDLSKFKQELELPKTQTPTVQPEAPSQEFLDAIKARQQSYMQSIDKGYKSFDGYSTKVKDELVELPIAFKATDEDKADIKKIAESVLSTLDVNPYFENRWFTKDKATGEPIPNTTKIMSDLMLLEKTEKVLQGTANNAATDRLNAYLKTRKNTDLSGDTNRTNLQQPEGDKREKEIGYLFANS